MNDKVDRFVVGALLISYWIWLWKIACNLDQIIELLKGLQ